MADRLLHWFCVIALTLCACLGLVQGAAAQEDAAVQAVPALSARVIDQTGTLKEPEKQALEAKLAAFEKAKGSQIVVLILPSTAPEDIASYANRVANTWKIGRSEVGDGLLLIVAKNDRKMRIEVAKTLEGAVPDLAASRIIEQNLKPAFRQGDYAGGINAALDRITALVAGEALPEPAAQRTKNKSSNWLDSLINITLLALFFVPVAASAASRVLGNKLGALATALGAGFLVWLISSFLFLGLGAAILVFIYALLSLGRGGADPVIFGGGLPSGGWGGGGFGGSSGGFGGFGSGGGGDFGGGGASGDW